MDKKLAGLICGIISMVSVVVFFLWGYIGNAWGHSWLVFLIGGVACAIVSMVANYMEETGKTEKSDKKSEKKSDK